MFICGGAPGGDLDRGGEPIFLRLDDRSGLPSETFVARSARTTGE